MDCQSTEIQVILLCESGKLPAPGASRPTPAPDAYRYPAFAPRNDLEVTLLSGWVNTHQAMFLATACAAHCVTGLAALLSSAADLEQIQELSQRAIDCRHASAVYTSLPFLTRDLYQAYLRPSMRSVHPGFSGVSNAEASTWEQSLRDLKQAHERLSASNRGLAQALRPQLEGIFAAERDWWRYHAHAMARYVTTPVSLARLDSRAQEVDFSRYRRNVLRNPKAMADYDRYFGVERSEAISPSDYRATLQAVLERSDPFIESAGPLAKYRARGYAALFRTLEEL